MKLLMLTILLIALSYIAPAQETGDTSYHNSKGKPWQQEMENVTVSALSSRQQDNLQSAQMGKTDIPVSMLTKTAAIGGEPDIIKALQLTPGVKRGTEGSINMYVRGGGADENLILLDGAPMYNTGHLLGFFSMFNSAALKDVQLYKSSFPAMYGGRLSSVMDVRTRDGKTDDFAISASAGTIASSATVQGPIIKDRLSFIVSGRRTYIDKLYKTIPYYFYDMSAKTMFVVNSENRIYAGFFTGEDVLKMNPAPDDDLQVKSTMNIGNKIATLRWNHTAESGQYASDLLFYYSGFKYNIDGSIKDNNLYLHSAIKDIGFREDLRLYYSASHKITMGISVANRVFNPSIVNTTGPLLERFGNSHGVNISNIETGVYVQDEYRINDIWQLQGGVRFSQNVAGKKFYFNPEPRLALRYLVDERNSLKVSYARMVQYMHQVSGSSLQLPTDLWYPAGGRVDPGVSDQISAGYYHNIAGAGISLSGEVYYKLLNNVVEYKEGAMLIMNHNYENELVAGRGRSYGIELFASRTSGKFTGWLGYTLSYATRVFDSLNMGQEFYARYDRRNDVSFVGMYDITKRWSVSSNIVYATGAPFTGQTGQYVVPTPGFTGVEVMPAYTGRNELRLSASFRIDIDVQYKFKLGEKLRGDLHLCVYNVMNRTQPHTVSRVWDDAKQAYAYRQTGLFGTITAGSVNFNL